MNKTALIYGSSGLVGSKLLAQLLANDHYGKVKVFVRKPLPVDHSKLEQVIIDFDDADNIRHKAKGDEVYICLGTTMAKAGSKEAFYKVDHDFVVRAATSAAANGVPKLCLISSMGADVHAWVYYSKVKGEVEQEISRLPFEAIHIVRPSLLLGDRKEQRSGEKLGILISKAVTFIFIGPLAKYKPIEDETVARSMISYMESQSTGVHIHFSDDLQKFANP